MASPPDNTPIRRVTNTVSGAWRRLEPVRRRVRSRFEVDTRSLAALRIALGSILLVDLIHRAGHLEYFYTDSGVYPLSAYEATYTDYNGLSIHALSGDLWFQALLFLVAGLFALALVLGYRTRLVGLVSFVLLFSLHARNPAVLNGSDRLIRVLLLVSLAAPLGERWSIDALRRGSARRTVTSIGGIVVLVQPIVIFTQNAMLKHRGEEWYAGDALEIAFANDMMTILLGDVLVEYPTVLTALNFVWIGLLSGSVVFLLLTDGRLRALAAVAYIGMFAGMLATMAVGPFPLGLMAAVLPFLTTPFWDWLAQRVPARWRDRWRERRPTAESLGRLGRPPVEHRVLGALERGGYERVASATVRGARLTMGAIGLVVVVWILLFAAEDVAAFDPPDELDRDHVDQQWWGLYAPDPSTSYSWYVVEAQLANGTTVDAFDGGEVDFDRPPEVADTYDTFRHRKFMQRVRDSGKVGYSDAIAAAYIQWVCEYADRRQVDRVAQVTVYRMYQPSPVDGEFEPADRRVVMTRGCETDYLSRLTDTRDQRSGGMNPDLRRSLEPTPADYDDESEDESDNDKPGNDESDNDI